MLLNAANVEVNRWNQRAIGVGTITFALLLHGLAPRWGIQLQNALGFFKIGVLVFIIIAGFVALGGVSAASSLDVKDIVNPLRHPARSSRRSTQPQQLRQRLRWQQV